MTKGTTDETIDGMSLEKINKIITALKQEKYCWKPVRRVTIPKKNGKTRPLGIPSWSDKLLQDVMRTLLEAYYEPQFSKRSHGFRPNRGCHTALQEIKRVWHGTKWFIEGDIKGCFDNIDHDILINILRKDIKDNRFIRLLGHLLKAGYLENWHYHPTRSGTPQGGIISPLLANIYLNRLDKYVDEELIPIYQKGKRRRHNPEYDRVSNMIYAYRKMGNIIEAKKLEKVRRTIPTLDTDDPNYRRLRYIRYADDFVLGFVGSKEEAQKIKEQLRQFLKEQLKMELSEEKTLITHATTQKARFLGYNISVTYCNSKITTNRRAINGGIALRLPTSFVHERSKFYMRKGKAIHRAERIHETDYSIICRYQSEYRGFVQYYQYAENIAWLNALQWKMQTSLLKTLANKYKSSVAKMARKYKSTVQTEYGPRKCLETRVQRKNKPPLVARFGGIPLKVNGQKVKIVDDYLGSKSLGRNELLSRLLAETCEQCSSTQDIEVHHIRKLSDISKSKPEWAVLMASRNRKTLVVCRQCHDDIHAGRPLKNK
jgi:group II intron reverse transcriptase/maturase